MITSYKQLTGKYLRANRKRSILTVIGIILSVALISSIGLFFQGIQDAEIQSAKDMYGSYHLAFQKVNQKLVSEITNNPKVSRSGLYSVENNVKLKKGLAVSIVTATDKALELFPFKAKLGKLPENNNEVAMEKWILDIIDKNAVMGEKITFHNKDYKLVGILEDNIETQIDNKGIVLSKSDNVDMKSAGLLVEISSKTNLRKAVDEIKQLGGKNPVSENKYLIAMQGAGDSSTGANGIYFTIGIIIGIVVISTIAVIYNSFQISVVERIKQFGLLRAVGTTPKQIRGIVLREATILAVIGVPLGLMCGVIAILGIGFVFKLIGGDTILPMKLAITPKIMLISGMVGLASIYLSALLPAFFAGRISPLIAISGRNSITKEKIKRRKSIISQKLFGFEGALAAKNIKRSRKRYRITVFSIIISVVLFVTFKSFMDMAFTISTDINESKDVNFTVIRTKGAEVIDNKIVDNIKALKSVDRIYKVYRPYSMDMAINKSSEVKEIRNMGKIYKETALNGSKKTLIASSISIYDNDSIKISRKYLESGILDTERLNKENGVILINKNRVYNEKTQKSYYGPIANMKVGDEIDLQYNNPGSGRVEFGKGKIQRVKVMAIMKNDPFNYNGNDDGLKIITTEEMGRKLTGQMDIKPISLNIFIKNIKDEISAKTEIEDAIKSNASLKVINNIDNNRRGKSAILMVQILLYGFVVVVSLIGSVNIVNTLTTNIIVRKREFATLKSIGLTQRGLKKMIVLEGFLYGIVGTIYGGLIGCGFSYLMYRGLYGARELGWSIPWNAIGIAGVAALVIGYLSVLSPLSRIKKENLIEAVREDF